MIRKHIEAGLIGEWKWKTWVRMKEEALARGYVIDHKEKPNVAPLTFEDIQSPLLLLGFSFALTTIVFVMECLGPSIK